MCNRSSLWGTTPLRLVWGTPARSSHWVLLWTHCWSRISPWWGTCLCNGLRLLNQLWLRAGMLQLTKSWLQAQTLPWRVQRRRAMQPVKLFKHNAGDRRLGARAEKGQERLWRGSPLETSRGRSSRRASTEIREWDFRILWRSLAVEKGRLVGPPKERKEKERKERQKAKEESTRERRAKEEAEERAGADPLKGGLARVEDEAKGACGFGRCGWCATCWRCRPGLGFRGEGTLSRHSAVGMHRISRWKRWCIPCLYQPQQKVLSSPFWTFHNGRGSSPKRSGQSARRPGGA